MPASQGLSDLLLFFVTGFMKWAGLGLPCVYALHLLSAFATDSLHSCFCVAGLGTDAGLVGCRGSGSPSWEKPPSVCVGESGSVGAVLGSNGRLVITIMDWLHMFDDSCFAGDA